MKLENITLGIATIKREKGKGHIYDNYVSAEIENKKFYYGSYHVVCIYDYYGRFSGYGLKELIY